jgi:hypothetical protein
MVNLEPNSSQDASNLAGAIVLILSGLITLAWIGFYWCDDRPCAPSSGELFRQLIGEACCANLYWKVAQLSPGCPAATSIQPEERKRHAPVVSRDA